MTIRELRSGDTRDTAMTRGEYYELRDSDPRPWPEQVTRLLQAIEDAPDEAWRAKAACKGSTDMFFPHDRDKSNYTKARKICDGCPVRQECADAGVDEVHGMWGGQSPKQRRLARRFGSPRPNPDKQTALDLARKGMSDRQVEEATGIPRRNVQFWRRSEGMIRDTHGRLVS